jgi:outer membrane lipopolysaccharide assembly protein LptE/RlpB
MNRKNALPLLILLVTLTGCGYHLMGGNGLLPSNIKTVAVLPFQRRVPVLQLDQRVTEAVTREVARRMKVKVQNTTQGADAVIHGSINAYRVAPLSYDSAGRANRYQVTMAASVKMTDASGNILYQSKKYRFSEVYERSSVASGYINEEVVAFDVVARDYARALVASILEGGGGK